MIELIVLCLFISAYFLGRIHGHGVGYEKGKERWRHDSNPVSRGGFEETSEIADTINDLGYDGTVSVQTREYPNGDPVWFVETRKYNASLLDDE